MIAMELITWLQKRTGFARASCSLSPEYGGEGTRVRGVMLIILLLTSWISTEALAQTAPFAATTQPSAISAPATVAAFYCADLFAKDSGYISQVSVDIGDHVKKGQLLATIDDPELALQLGSSKAILAAREEQAKAAESAVEQTKAMVEVARRQLVGMQADRDLAKVTLKRMEELFAGNAATVQQMDESRARAQVAVSGADVAEAKIAAAQSDLSVAQANRAVATAQVHVAEADVKRIEALLQYTKIEAPFDGVITRRWVNPGELVQAAVSSRTMALFTCQQIDVVRIFCDVPESHAVRIVPGTLADVKLYGSAGETYHGTVTRIASALDPTTRTMRVEIDLANPKEALRPGMYAQVTLTPGSGKKE